MEFFPCVFTVFCFKMPIFVGKYCYIRNDYQFETTYYTSDYH